MQSLVSQSAGAPNSPSCIQHSTQSLIDRLFIGKGLGNFRFQHYNITSFAQAPQILSADAAFHRGEIIF